MKLDQSYCQAPVFTKLIDDIIKKDFAEKIFLLSACRCCDYTDTIFKQRPVLTDKDYRFDLLVLTAENEHRDNDMVQEIIENKCSSAGMTTAIVLPVQQFNNWLMDGHPFARKVVEEAFVCYDAGRIPLAIPDHGDAMVTQNELASQFKNKLEMATEFISGAQLFTIRKQWPLAAFNLHQAAEQIYTGIIQLITGLRIQTHNLDKLYRYSRYLWEGLTAVFPCNNEREKQLFKLLQKAYIESRYSETYKIKPEEVTILNDRVLMLQQIAMEVGKVGKVGESESPKVYSS